MMLFMSIKILILAVVLIYTDILRVSQGLIVRLRWFALIITLALDFVKMEQHVSILSLMLINRSVFGT